MPSREAERSGGHRAPFFGFELLASVDPRLSSKPLARKNRSRARANARRPPHGTRGGRARVMDCVCGWGDRPRAQEPVESDRSNQARGSFPSSALLAARCSSLTRALPSSDPFDKIIGACRHEGEKMGHGSSTAELIEADSRRVWTRFMYRLVSFLIDLLAFRSLHTQTDQASIRLGTAPLHGLNYLYVLDQNPPSPETCTPPTGDGTTPPGPPAIPVGARGGVPVS